MGSPNVSPSTTSHELSKTWQSLPPQNYSLEEEKFVKFNPKASLMLLCHGTLIFLIFQKANEVFLGSGGVLGYLLRKTLDSTVKQHKSINAFTENHLDSIKKKANNNKNSHLSNKYVVNSMTKTTSISKKNGNKNPLSNDFYTEMPPKHTKTEGKNKNTYNLNM